MIIYQIDDYEYVVMNRTRFRVLGLNEVMYLLSQPEGSNVWEELITREPTYDEVMKWK